MSHPNARGYTGSDRSATFLRQQDGHLSTNRYDTEEGDYESVETFQNAHKMGSEELMNSSYE